MLINSIKETIENNLSILVGERVRRLRRAALMLGIDFGEDVEFKSPTGPEQSKISIVPKYALHIHSSWRLLKDNDICLGHSDLFSRMSGFKYQENSEEAIDSIEFFRVSEDLTKEFEAKAIKVTRIEASELGDLIIYMEQEYSLEIFVDAEGDTESWRFLKRTEKENHFVVFDSD